MGKRARRRGFDRREAERNVAATAQSAVGAGDRLGAAVDLSRGAVEARLRARAKGGSKPARQLIEEAASIMQRAVSLQTRANRVHAGGLRDRLDAMADEAVVAAALKVRLASATPLTKSVLEHLALDRVQTVRAEVAAAAGRDMAALAVDTTRRIRDQRIRVKREGIPT